MIYQALTISYVCIASCTLSSPYSLLLLNNFLMWLSLSFLFSGTMPLTPCKYSSALVSICRSKSENVPVFLWEQLVTPFLNPVFNFCMYSDFIPESQKCQGNSIVDHHLGCVSLTVRSSVQIPHQVEIPLQFRRETFQTWKEIVSMDQCKIPARIERAKGPFLCSTSYDRCQRPERPPAFGRPPRKFHAKRRKKGVAEAWMAPLLFFSNMARASGHLDFQMIIFWYFFMYLFIYFFGLIALFFLVKNYLQKKHTGEFSWTKTHVGGYLGLRPGWPPTILEISLTIQHVCQGGCLGLRPGPPPFCVKLAGAAEAWGPFRPVIPE